MSMKTRKPLIKNYSKGKKSYTRVPSGDKRTMLDTKVSMFTQDFKLNYPQGQVILNDKARTKVLLSPTNIGSGKASNLS